MNKYAQYSKTEQRKKEYKQFKKHLICSGKRDFNTREEAEEAINLNSGQKPYLCDNCGKYHLYTPKKEQLSYKERNIIRANQLRRKNETNKT